MSRYDRVREAFIEYSDAEQRYVDENLRLALLIVNGLRDYLEMPQHFEKQDDGVITFKSYTPFYGVDEDGNTQEAKTVVDALTHRSDGTLKFAFGVILERSENTFPKRNLIVHVDCKRTGEKVVIDIPGRSLEVTFDGEKCPEIEAVHEMIYDQVIDWLKHRPGDGQGFSKVGFDLN